MAGLQCVPIIGRLGARPEAKGTQGRKALSTFRVAVNEGRKDGKTLAGVLVSFDAYSLMLQVVRDRPPPLVYQQCVTYLRPEKDTGSGDSAG